MIVFYDNTGKIIHAVGANRPDVEITLIPQGTTPLYLDDATNSGVAQNIADYTINLTTKQPVYSPIPLATKLANASDVKIAVINDQCNATILGGFSSTAKGVSHQYAYDYEAQLNISGAYSFANANASATFDWNTKDAGVIVHNTTEIKQLFNDGMAWKVGNFNKYRTKSKQYKACTALADLDKIAWPKNPNPPAVPVGLAGTPGAGQVSLSWTANSDVTMQFGGGYNVYVDTAITPANTSLITGTTYTATGLVVGVHTFKITAVDTDGLESVKSAQISVTV